MHRTKKTADGRPVESNGHADKERPKYSPSRIASWLALLLTGICLYYADGVMERLAAYHGLECAECVGMTAVMDCDRLGERIWLQQPDGAAEGPFLVVDCAKKEDRERLAQRGLVAEVDWQTARRWEMWGPIDCAEASEPPWGGYWPRILLNGRS